MIHRRWPNGARGRREDVLLVRHGCCDCSREERDSKKRYAHFDSNGDWATVSPVKQSTFYMLLEIQLHTQIRTGPKGMGSGSPQRKKVYASVGTHMTSQMRVEPLLCEEANDVRLMHDEPSSMLAVRA